MMRLSKNRRPMLQWLGFLGSLVLITSASIFGTYHINRLIGANMDSLHGMQTFRVMTWNIGKLYLKWDSRASDADLGHIAEVIREIDPHVVALQELTGPIQLGRLAILLGPEWFASVAEDYYDRRAGLLVRLPVEFVKLPTSTGRVAQAGIVELEHGGRVVVASVHLDAFDAKRRLLQAEEMVAGIQRLDVTDVMLAGDFNFDAAVIAQGSIDQRLYRFLTKAMSDAGKGAGATTIISRRLDYIFYRSDRIKSTRARVIHDKRINTMDHDPLVVEFLLKR